MQPDDIRTNERQSLIKKGISLLSGKNSRIKNLAASILLLVALVADLLSLIPFVGDLVAPIFWIAIAIYLWRIGCGFLNARRLATETVSFIAELIPAVQELPTIIIGMAVVIAMVRFEDKTGISVVKSASSGRGRTPLNSHGVRQPRPILVEGRPSIRNPNTRPLNMDGVRLPSE